MMDTKDMSARDRLMIECELRALLHAAGEHIEVCENDWNSCDDCSVNGADLVDCINERLEQIRQCDGQP